MNLSVVFLRQTQIGNISTEVNKLENHINWFMWVQDQAPHLRGNMNIASLSPEALRNTFVCGKYFSGKQDSFLHV